MIKHKNRVKSCSWRDSFFGVTCWKFFLSFSVAVLITACEKTQDDIDLPVYEGSIGGDFSLPSSLNRTFELTELQGKVVLINFGFTHCPDICPMVLTRLAKITKELKENHGVTDSQLQTLFISVDPERDTAKHLKDYLVFFNPNFIGLTGTIEQIGKVAKQYAVYFEKQQLESEEYSVVHNSKIFLLDKRGRLRSLYSDTDADEKMIKDIVSLAKASI